MQQRQNFLERNIQCSKAGFSLPRTAICNSGFWPPEETKVHHLFKAKRKMGEGWICGFDTSKAHFEDTLNWGQKSEDVEILGLMPN